MAKHLNLTIHEEDIRSGAIKLLKEVRPSWDQNLIKFKVSDSTLWFIVPFKNLPFWNVMLRWSMWFVWLNSWTQDSLSPKADWFVWRMEKAEVDHSLG